MTKITVIGLGYIGLPTALLFANSGYDVTGVDINIAVVESLNSGKLHLNEPGLEELFAAVRDRFSATTVTGESDIYLIAVPTPIHESMQVSNLNYIRSAAEGIAPHLREGNLVILESTVPPGASERVVIPILEKSGLKAGEFFYTHCPERAIPGRTLHEMIHNDRIVGGIDKASTLLALTLYSSYVRGTIHTTDVCTAEFVKLIENTSRDVNIALANEIAQIAEHCDINAWEAISLANKHPRVNLLNPGPGVGGHCIAVDPWFLVENSSRTGLIQIAREINSSMPNYVINMIRPLLEDLPDPTLTIFGVSYKGNVPDTRETPAMKLIHLAMNEGYRVKCYDPQVTSFEHELCTIGDSVKDSDCIVVMADHDAFKLIDPSTLSMRRKNLIETRNYLDHKKWRDSGFTVKVLGDGRKADKWYGEEILGEVVPSPIPETEGLIPESGRGNA
jgi:UDP-N-acetyl-D-mannosaminuronic acid dehydrogenase